MLNQLIQWCLDDQDRALETAELLLVVAIALFVWFCPKRVKHLIYLGESAVLRFYSRRKYLSIAIIALAPAVLRVALLPVIPYPIPFVADEMSHLLIADTVASGRLTNPPHPLSGHFESTYVVQKRVYASVYPPAHGIVMGAAQAAGLHPWFGVLAEVTVLLFAIGWMLDAWFPPRWVILGTLIATIRLGIWMFSYWGGALAAIGGVLIAGAVRQIARRPRPVHGVMIGLGLTILASTRPYEGLLCGIAAAVALLLIARKRGVHRPACAAMIVSITAGAGLTGYYNWRVTGSPLSVPNTADQREHGTPTSLILFPHPPQPPGLERWPDLVENYRWQRDTHAIARDPAQAWKFYSKKLDAFWHFYLHPLWTVALLALPFALRQPPVRWALAAGAFVSFGTALYPFYFPHYSAPVAGILVILILQGIRGFSAMTRRRARAASALAPALVLAAVGIGLFLVAFAFRFHETFRARAWSMYPPPSLARHRLQEQLTAAGGQHLVVVRYGPVHNYHFGSVHNRAAIDTAPIVFARELDPSSNARLLAYFRGRTVWLFEPDVVPARLTPYPQRPN